MKDIYDVLVIGAGAVGCAIARELSKYELDTAVVEKSADVASSTSGRNSAVVHAGFNNRPGSLMAKLCVRGNAMFEDLAKELDFEYIRTGKVLVSFNEEDEKTIDGLYRQGQENGCRGLRLIDKEELETLIPGTGGVSGMYSPYTAIINPFHYCITLAENAFENGVDFFFSTAVTGASDNGEYYTVRTTKGDLKAKTVINSAGLSSADVSSLFGIDGYYIYPCRGEYLILDVAPENVLPLPVYPAPRKGDGGLGVHLTPTTDKNIIIGPSATYIDNEDPSTTGDILSVLEREAHKLLPATANIQIIGQYAGIRPKQTKPGVGGYQDFVIKEEIKGRFINLIGIESPGLTASYPIALMIAEDILPSSRVMRKKESFTAPKRRERPLRELSSEEKAERIKEDSEWGEIICRCREVSKHEIRKAIENPLGVRTLSAVKYRAWPMTGRCSGGYCLQKIVGMLIHEYGMKAEDILYKNEGSRMFTGEVK